MISLDECIRDHERMVSLEWDRYYEGYEHDYDDDEEYYYDDNED